jgi:hypothetical protein
VIPALTKTEKTKLAGIILGEISPSAVLFIVLSRPQNTKELIALLGPFIPGDTLREKIAYAFTVTRPAFDSDARFRDVAEGVLDKLRGVTDDEGEPVEVDGEAPASGITADKLKAVMATPMFVMRDNSVVRRQAAQLKAAGYNAVASLVDLQTGEGQRDYIIRGRMATKLTDGCMTNLDAVIEAGLVPIVIIRNDWAVRTGSGHVPSIGGQPTSQADFYSAARLRYEKQFLDSLQGYYKHIHIQLSIEPEHPASADFALQLARHLRAAGFANRLLINPLSPAVAAHKAIQAGLAAAGVEWARSHHGDSVPPDPVWNTDGDTALNGSNVRARVAKMQASGKDWILWTQSLANSHGDFPAECMDVGLSEQTLPAMITGHEKGFLWKPVGENSGKLRVLLPEVWTGKVDRGSVQLWRGGERIETLASTGVANGNREHFQAKKPGGAYNAGVEVRATEGGRTWVWKIPNPAGRNENLKATRVGDRLKAGENR